MLQQTLIFYILTQQLQLKRNSSATQRVLRNFFMDYATLKHKKQNAGQTIVVKPDIISFLIY